MEKRVKIEVRYIQYVTYYDDEKDIDDVLEEEIKGLPSWVGDYELMDCDWEETA